MVSGESSESHIVNLNILPPNSNTKNTNTQIYRFYSTRKLQRLDRLSPSNSPHKLGKDPPKHSRTIAVKNLSKSLHKAVTTTFSSTVRSTLTIENFTENADEKKVQDALSNKLQSYIALKCICDHYPEIIAKDNALSEMRQFLNEEAYKLHLLASNW